MRPLLALAMLLCSAAAAQGYRDWNSLGRLKPGDTVLVTLDQKHPVFTEFRRYTPEELVTGTLDARKPDVVAVERYRQGVWGRGTRAAVFGAVGFGVGFGLGAVAGGCTAPGIISICPGRGNSGLIGGAAGAVLGGTIGALWPHRALETIYTVR